MAEGMAAAGANAPARARISEECETTLITPTHFTMKVKKNLTFLPTKALVIFCDPPRLQFPHREVFHE